MPEKVIDGPLNCRGRGVQFGLVALFAAIALVAAGCGSSSKGKTAEPTTPASPSGANGATNACLSKAQTFLAPYANPPTTLGPDFSPLQSRPPTGLTLINLVNGTVPSILQSSDGLKDAVAAIGWHYQAVSYDGTTAQLASDMTQAIAQKPAVIFMSAVDPGTIANEINAAKAAGIVVHDSSSGVAPYSYPGYASTSTGNADNKLQGQVIANWILADSKCNATIGIFSLSGIPPLVVIDNGMTSVINSECPKCTISQTLLPPTDLGTPAGTQAVVSKLQSDPSIKYVMTPIGALFDTLPAALKAAGISGVKIVGGVPSGTNIGSLHSGQTSMWVGLNAYLTGWTALNAILQAMQAKKPLDTEATPRYVVLTPSNVGNVTDVPIYPTDYAAEFKQLWKVG